MRYTTREMFDEIRRDIAALREDMRNARHSLTATVRGIELRLTTLETFQRDANRRLNENDDRAATWIPRIEHLLAEETMAIRVKTTGWSKRERLLGYGLFVFAFIGAVGTIVSVLVLWNTGG